MQISSLRLQALIELFVNRLDELHGLRMLMDRVKTVSDLIKLRAKMTSSFGAFNATLDKAIGFHLAASRDVTTTRIVMIVK